MGHPRIPRLVNSWTAFVKMQLAHLLRLLTMANAPHICLLLSSQLRRFMYDVANHPLLAHKQMAPSKFWNKLDHPVSSFRLDHMLMAPHARSYNTGRIALLPKSPRIHKWRIGHPLAGNSILRLRLSNLRAHLYLRTLTKTWAHPGPSLAHAQLYSTVNL